MSILETYRSLTNNNGANKAHDLLDFANQMGWNPSYYFKYDDAFDNGQVIVEHRLEYTAVLSFLNTPYQELSKEEQRKLVNISYNNLVDWNVVFDPDYVTYVYNRHTEKRVIDYKRIISKNDEEYAFKVDSFLEIIERKPNPNIPSLDSALMETISYWKRTLSIQLGISNKDLSTLFNAIIFIRAIEDSLKRQKKLSLNRVNSKLLLELQKEISNPTILNVLLKALEELSSVVISKELLDLNSLNVFDRINPADLYYLFRDFYENTRLNIPSFNGYNYDFSIMTKHALSRIYEGYVSILQTEKSQQIKLFEDKPNERVNRELGAYYTPQYLASFFAKYIKKQFSPSQFQQIKVAEPAVGSGIFLRTLLELQAESKLEILDKYDFNQVINNVLGVDIDENACQATRLSLSLLYFAIDNSLPQKLKIFNSDSISFFEKEEWKNHFDVIISNPPFIRYEQQNQEFQDKLKNYLTGIASGRIDSYLAFLKIAIDSLKPNGYGLFVLPHSFLITQNATKVREFISINTSIKLLADLSAIPVFESTGVYVVLLIFQKKHTDSIQTESATILKCRNFVGKALEAVLNNNFANDNFYSIYQVEQEYFKEKEWHILLPKEYQIVQKLKKFPSIDNFLDVKQGFITGADDIFILEKNQIPKGEGKLYIPYLPDREMEAYISEPKSSKYVFYPFIDGQKVTIEQIERGFPKTWEYLNTHKSILELKKHKKEWWNLHSPLSPQDLLQPKITTPHLTIMPRFSLDIKGEYGVSHSPFFKLKEVTKSTGDIYGEYSDIFQVISPRDLLYYFLGILNSTPCYWYISTHSHKYNNNYTMHEVKTLKQTPVPMPSVSNQSLVMKFIKLVKQRLVADSKNEIKIEKELDLIAFQLYDLTPEEITLFS